MIVIRLERRNVGIRKSNNKLSQVAINEVILGIFQYKFHSIICHGSEIIQDFDYGGSFCRHRRRALVAGEKRKTNTRGRRSEDIAITSKSTVNNTGEGWTPKGWKREREGLHSHLVN
jgi:hypothetical protein